MTGLASSALLDHFEGTFIGHAVANSLGGPFEGLTADEVNTSMELDGRGYAVPVAGSYVYRDDIKMAICVAESLCDQRLYDAQDIMERFVDWYMSGDLRGIGVTVENAIKRYQVTHDITLCGEDGTWSAGNGGVMRITPVALFAVFAQPEERLALCASATSLTHRNDEAIAGSFIVAQTIADLVNGRITCDTMVRDILNEEQSSEVLTTAFRSRIELVDHCLQSNVDPNQAIEIIGTGGYVVDTVACALYIASRNPMSYPEAVTMAIRAGGDADTIAGIVGALVGAAHGTRDIPIPWRNDLEDYRLLRELAHELLALAIEKHGAHTTELNRPLEE